MVKSVIVTVIKKRRIDATTSAVAGRRAYRSGRHPGSERDGGRHLDSNLPLVDLVGHRAHALGVRPRELDRKNPPAAGESTASTRQDTHRRRARHARRGTKQAQ